MERRVCRVFKDFHGGAFRRKVSTESWKNQSLCESGRDKARPSLGNCANVEKANSQCEMGISAITQFRRDQARMRLRPSNVGASDFFALCCLGGCGTDWESRRHGGGRTDWESRRLGGCIVSFPSLPPSRRLYRIVPIVAAVSAAVSYRSHHCRRLGGSPYYRVFLCGKCKSLVCFSVKRNGSEVEMKRKALFVGVNEYADPQKSWKNQNNTRICSRLRRSREVSAVGANKSVCYERQLQSLCESGRDRARPSQGGEAASVIS